MDPSFVAQDAIASDSEATSEAHFDTSEAFVRARTLAPRFEQPAQQVCADDVQTAMLRRLHEGDARVVGEVYAQHRHDVARLVYRMLGAHADVEDVIQEVFFQVFRSLKKFRGNSKLSTWLHRLTVNVVLMYRRAARSRPVYAEELPDDATEDVLQLLPDEEVERRARVAAFGRLLDRIADKKRVVFILHDLEGMPPTEISKIVGCPVLTVRTRLFHARRELEALLATEPALASSPGRYALRATT